MVDRADKLLICLLMAGFLMVFSGSGSAQASKDQNTVTLSHPIHFPNLAGEGIVLKAGTYALEFPEHEGLRVRNHQHSRAIDIKARPIDIPVDVDKPTALLMEENDTVCLILLSKGRVGLVSIGTSKAVGSGAGLSIPLPGTGLIQTAIRTKIMSITAPSLVSPAVTHYLAHHRGGNADWYDSRAEQGDRFRHDALRNSVTPGGLPDLHSTTALPGQEPGGSLLVEPGGSELPPLPDDGHTTLPPDPGHELPSEQGGPFLKVPGKYWKTGWVYELKRTDGTRFSFADVKEILVHGTGVTGKVLPETCVRTSTPNINEGGCGTTTSTRAFVLFLVADDAPHGVRQVTVHLKNGTKQPAQYPLLVGRNGTGTITRLTYLDLPTGPLIIRNLDIRSIQGAEELVDAPLVEIEILGQRLGNAKFITTCLLDGGITQAESNEGRIVIRGKFRHTSGREVQSSGTLVFTRPSTLGPFDSCPWTLYDQVMDEAQPLAPGFLGTHPDNFNYLDYAKAKLLKIGPSVKDFARHPGAIGDSLSHGAYGITIEPKTQLWAYPPFVVRQMGGRVDQLPPTGDPGNIGLRINMIQDMWGFEDMIKGNCPQLAGADLSVMNQELKVRINDCIATRFPPPGAINPNFMTPSMTVDTTPTSLPTHAGISGFDYTTVLRTNGVCTDIIVQRTGTTCDKAPGTARSGLDGSASTPIEIMEQTKPHFVFATVGGNHALACALMTLPLNTCLDWGRFEEDATETFDRLAKIPQVRGGIVFGVPPLTALAHLRDVTFRVARIEFAAHSAPRLRIANVSVKMPYWRLPSAEQRVQQSAAAIQTLAGFLEVLASPFEQLQDNIDLAAVPADVLHSIATQLNQAATEIQASSLDQAEVDQLDGFVRAMNAKMQELSQRNRFAYLDAYTMFQNLRTNGLLIRRADGTPICTVRAEFPLPTQAAGGRGCGVFSLDGFHPNKFGHGILTKHLIETLNAYYDLKIPLPDLGPVYQSDSLNQAPIDIIPYLRNASLGCSLPPLSLTGASQWLSQAGFLCQVNVTQPSTYASFIATFITAVWNANFVKSHFYAAFKETDGSEHSFRNARQNAGSPYLCGRATPTNMSPNPNHPLGLWCSR
jgi:hypothetical protein